MRNFFKKIARFICVLTVYILAVSNIIQSENLTITTYYPAPYGGYVSLLTTNNTWLARDSGNVGIGTASPGFKLDVQGGSVRIGGRLGTQNFNPDTGYPYGWAGGIHTWDVYAEGSVGVGQGGAVNSIITNGGIGYFSYAVGIRAWPSTALDVNGDALIRGNLTVWGSFNFCRTIGNGSNGWSDPCDNNERLMEVVTTEANAVPQCASWNWVPVGSAGWVYTCTLMAEQWVPSSVAVVCCRTQW